MANVRQLKKAIRTLCGSMASETLVASALVKGFDQAKVNDILVNIADLQSSALGKVKFSFDKSQKDFENRSEFNKSKNKYYKEAYSNLKKMISDKAVVIVNEMNSAMPKK